VITIGIPTLNRYDLLSKAIESALKGSVVPDRILVVDNGGSLPPIGGIVEIYRPGYNLGVAGSWNYIIKHTSEHRIIINDDIEFRSSTIEKIINCLNNGPGLVMTVLPNLNGFSCFAIKDSFVEKIGYFDEEISPGYAYYEDNDYVRRIVLAGLSFEVVTSGAEATHATSSTLKAFTLEQRMEHDRKFHLAQKNYMRKWGGMPLQEVYTTPYGKGG
jgi:GT2 family glycosyltransferase